MNTNTTNSPTHSRHYAEGMLVIATFFWGWTFPVIKDAISDIPIFAFLFIRFGLAAIFMLRFVKYCRLASLKLGGYLGLLLFLSFGFQTWGLHYISASKCAFITGLNLIWVALFFARDIRSYLAVILALIGLWLLTSPSTAEATNIGDVLTLIASFFIAVHLIVIQRLDNQCGSGELAMIQFATVAVLSLVLSLSFEPTLFPEKWTFNIVFALVITVLGATLFSFWVQTHFQRRTTAVRAALIFVMEPIFALIFAVSFYNEELTIPTIFGALFVFFAMCIASTKQKTSSKT